MLDVAIVGAGPIGSRSAYQLSLLGYNVSVLEKRPAAGLKICCTGIISQECVFKFNIPDDVVYHKVSSAKLFPPSGDYIKIVRPEVQACVVNRSAFDLHLAGLAQNTGAQYLFNTTVENMQVNKDRVILSCFSQGIKTCIEAKFVILACGFNSSLVRKSGLGQCRYFTTGAQVEVPAKDLEEIEIYFGSRIAPGYFSWLVPTKNGRALAGLMSRYSAGLYLRKWLSDLAAQGKIESGNSQICYSGIPIYPLSHTYKNRLLVVGDAAGQVKPTTGGGIYFGLLCADIAADTLHNSLLRNDYSSNTLLPYEKQWHRLLLPELKSEYIARRAFQLLKDRNIDNFFKEFKNSNIVDSILNNPNISFDRHGRLLIKALQLGITSRIRRLF